MRSQRRWRAISPWSAGLSGKLIWSYVILTLGLFGPLAFFARSLGRNALDQSIGQRLSSIGQATATQVSVELLRQLAPGDEQSRTYGNLHRKLIELVRATQVGRIQIIDANLRILVDSQANIPIGTVAHELAVDGSEIASAFLGQAGQSIRFRGRDGLLYKRGYAPIAGLSSPQATEPPLAVVAVLGSAAAFDALTRLDRWMLVYAAVGLGLVVLVGTVLSRRLTRPLRSLAAWAGRVGAGELEAPAPAPSYGGRDEIAQLSGTLETMRQGLAERDQRMQVMLAGIAHEVRNPLGGMELFVGLLRDDLAGDAPKLAHVKKIERELGHLNQVVHDFLAYARRAKPELAELDLATLIDEVREVTSSEATAADVTVTTRMTRPATIAGDRKELRRALLNLVSNALFASPRGGTVSLVCTTTERLVAVEVRDEGKGMSAELQEKIFTPFFTTKEKGTGLGLAFVKDIVEAHGGKLSVSSSPQQGATFRMEFHAWRPSSS